MTVALAKDTQLRTATAALSDETQRETWDADSDNHDTLTRLLCQLDPEEGWRGLRPVAYTDGRVAFMCEAHRAESRLRGQLLPETGV